MKLNELSKDSRIAVELQWFASEFAEIEDKITDLIRTPGHPIREEKQALDIVYGYGDTMRKALRELSMRLDRGALMLSETIEK